MAYDMNLASELWISFLKQLVNSVALAENNFDNLLSIGALIEKNIQGQIRDKRPGKGHALDSDVLKGRI